MGHKTQLQQRLQLSPETALELGGSPNTPTPITWSPKAGWRRERVAEREGKLQEGHAKGCVRDQKWEIELKP